MKFDILKVLIVALMMLPFYPLWSAYLTNEPMVISQPDGTKINYLASSPPDEVYIYRPNETTTVNGSINTAHFSSETGRTAIPAGTNPTPLLSNGSAGGLYLHSIGSAGATISFNNGAASAEDPTCVITAPVNGARIIQGDIVNVTVTATDPSPGSIARVEFYLDGSSTPAYTDYSSPYSWAWNTSDQALGERSITAVAIDNEDNSAVHSVTILLLSVPSEGFETGDFSAYEWVNNSSVPWTIQSSEKLSGTYAAKSGAISSNGTTELSLTLNVLSSGNVSFFNKVSSEANYDFMRFYIDGVEQAFWSGEVDWALRSYPVTAGFRTFKWAYTKDFGWSSGSDCAWLDHITFPPTGVILAPPQNLAASPSHQSVLLSWQAPASGTPTGYKIFKNSTLLTTVATLSYMDYAVTNGTNYSYYLKAVNSDGESDATTSVTATPNAIAPTNLTAVTGNNVINLSWTAATGRGDDRTISNYRIYRNGSALDTTASTTYQDNSVTNGTSYSYYVTTLYTDPDGESAASNTVNATALTEVILGSGTESTGTQDASPINVYYRSLHGQAVYTAAELNALGIFGPIFINELGFNITSLPDEDMHNFVVRMKHTTATNVTSWIGSQYLVTVYSNPSYRPTETGYNMYTLSTPFLWNGVDNLLIDTAFGINESWSFSGTVQYTDIASGYRYVRNEDYDQTDVFYGFGNNNTTSSFRPNVKLRLQDYHPPTITLNTSALDESLLPGQVTAQSFIIGNTGSVNLRYNMGVQALRSRERIKDATSTRNITGSSLSINADEYTPGSTVDWVFSVNCVSIDNEWLKSVIVTFPPGTVINSASEFVGGSGGNMIPDLTSGNGVTITWLCLSGNLGVVHPGETAIATVNVTIPESYSYPISIPYQILGEVYQSEPHILEGDFTLDPSVEPLDWFSVQPYSGILESNEEQLIVGSFSAMNLSPGSYQARIDVYTNDPNTPNAQINVTLNVIPPIEISAPLGTEQWLSGTDEDILWNYSGTGTTVDLDYSIDGGENWLAIGTVATIPSANSYTWTIPNTPSDNCQTRVTDSVEPFYRDYSGIFSIVLPEPPTTPLNLAITYDDATDELVLTWDAATGNPDSYMIYSGDTPDFTAWPETLAETVPATQTSYRISAAAISDKAFFRVSAVRNP
ncbi:MAG: Ig-like domain-containing protein [Candidatus Cloacimonetes bacterium]|nr:Ig-like domain-containing protein [Candidatus Cloacimonadota bacterium]MCB5268521.1 Ig-like domain-containing protein [Candidatus Cloacimonadota bacterium]MCK9334569.1 Ig-like domain-containing protein [Candidatus Cloacimonadota bacterium]MDD4667417.1 Ig-like domain-containing protein [Candidatus Cloacimonadota bacterium]